MGEFPKSGMILVDGSFDPLHHGHIDYFKEAYDLSRPVGCLVAPDSYTANKHKVLLKIDSRLKVLDSIRYLDYIFYGQIDTKDALGLIKPRFFYKGFDWHDKLPLSISNTCKEINCQIIFGKKNLESSTNILREYEKQ